MKNKNKKFSGFILTMVFFMAFFIFSFKITYAADLVDSDGDGLSDSEEIRVLHTDPNNVDTDGDGHDDYIEVYNGYSPRHVEQIKLSSLDSDDDGVPDSWEIRLGMDLLNPDTDADGYNDGVEVNNGYDPRSAQSEKIEKLIAVNIAGQKLAYYFDDIQLEDFLISGGVASMPTPVGDFMILAKEPTKVYGGRGFGFYYPDTKWNLHFTTQRWRYYIHGAYWHNNFGHPMSHGCVNVHYNNMERLYDFAQIGTKVEIS